MPRYFVFLLTFGFSNALFSQSEIIENKIFNENIKTVEIYKKGFRFAYPVIRLNSSEQLVLEFDELGEERSDLSYTVQFCNADFSPSDLNPIEYLQGYEENQLNDYQPSFNTRISYNHYYLEFPNDDISPLISGNYVLIVYADYDREKVVLQRRFSVLDEKTRIEGVVRRSSEVSTMMQNQEVEFTVTDAGANMSNPIDFMNVTVAQNNRTDRTRSLLKPDYIAGNRFNFLNPSKLNFPAGNEFRYFNLKTYRYTTDRVIHIGFEEPYYLFTLYPEKPEADLPYSYTQDINGDFLITAENVENPQTEAEYVLADFNFKAPKLPENSDYYVVGSFCDWQISEQNKLTYNFTTEHYELRLKLKQGFYNYEFVQTDGFSDLPDNARTEGNFSETENNYAVYVYYRKPGTYYDALVGYTVLNSLKK